jgi:hypothetical protein
MDPDYNTQRRKLVLPEYGRNVQKMINHLKTIEDREERNKAARTVVQIMQNMVHQGRDNGDLKRKLWDHLIVISNFELDVDTPYDPPEKESLHAKPDPIPYNTNPIRYKHYGRGIELLVEKAIEMEAGEDQDRLIKLIANHMKRSYLTWNKGQVADDIIFQDLITLSGNRLEIKKDLILADSREMFTKGRKKRNPRKK